MPSNPLSRVIGNLGNVCSMALIGGSIADLGSWWMPWAAGAAIAFYVSSVVVFVALGEFPDGR